jgi:hypothetical protein
MAIFHSGHFALQVILRASVRHTTGDVTDARNATDC